MRTHYKSLDGYVPTKELPVYVRHLINGMRGPRQGFSQKFKPRVYRPREVRVALSSPCVTVNLAAFGYHAANGEEIHVEDQSTWIGSDGEPNYTKVATYKDLAVVAHGWGRRGGVEVRIPVPYQGDAFYSMADIAQKAINGDDFGFFMVLVDWALEHPTLAPVAESEASP